MILPQAKVKHLLYRAGFGTGLQIDSWNESALWKKSNDDHLLNVVNKPQLDSDPREMKDKAKEVFEKSRQEIMKVNAAWIMQMSRQPDLRERMTFFWHNHFACRTLMPWFAQDLNNQIRLQALGSFSDLLTTVSKHPAMLQFLNNQQNRKDHPNENFAREVMELFTLGRGHYIEDDIKEAARAFTGWGFNFQGNFQYRPRQHDEGVKTFRGRTGNFQGDDIINMILEDPQTSIFITRKLGAFLVSDDGVSDSLVKEWSDDFYRSGYRIDRLVRNILNSDTFADPKNTGTRIKSPVELLVGILMQTDGKFEDDRSLVFIQRALGQVLFFPPNVSGWPSGKAWIDSSSLTFRLTLPRLLFSGDETEFRVRDEGDVNGLQNENAGRRRLHCNADWSLLANRFTKKSKEATLAEMEDFLLSRLLLPENRKWVAQITDKNKDDKELVKSGFIAMMSLPEYQMC
ncbi:MAG: DUF1800 domain-containing protein [Bacteroidetes bacterium]|nr:DUF1800 domain-containing protein [Bacteroidota bacterium]